MEIKDVANYRMLNRRYDDIVIIINHQIKIYDIHNKIANKIYIEYFNDFAEKFFGFKIDLIDKMLFNKIINRKMTAIINDFFKEEELYSKSKENICNYQSDLLNFFRKINNFSMKDSFGVDQIVEIKIFPLNSEKNKNIYKNYFYLIIRSLEIEIEFAKFKNKFFHNMRMKNNIDVYFDVYDEASSINEVKMLCSFKKKYINVPIILGTININKFYNDDILISSLIGMLSKNLRSDDFLGIINKKKIIISLFNCTYRNAEKVFSRLLNSIKSNSYIIEKYSNQMNNIFSYSYLELQSNDEASFIINEIYK